VADSRGGPSSGAAEIGEPIGHGPGEPIGPAEIGKPIGHGPDEPIVREELALLAEVTRALAATDERPKPSEAGVVEELEHIRDQLVKGGPDFYDQSALATRWSVQSSLLAQLRRSRAAPQVDPASPYFAHMRLRENGRVREVCLGRATRLDNGLRIVDWRHAPIAQLFYRYQQGDAYEEEISGRVAEGVVETRRAVTIRAAALERVEAPEGSFDRDESAGGWRRTARRERRLAGGEGAALRVHEGAALRVHAPSDGSGRRLGTEPGGAARRADKRLPDIAGLIDPEQFALIARPSSGCVVIRGAAGSGKTTVALHRIAYLAYEEPAFDSPATLFVVFSPALRDYVSHVLPALGVEGVSVRTFHEWAAEQRRRLLPTLPDRVREDTPALVQRVKLHPAIAVALARQVARTPGPATRAQVIDDWASLLTDAALLREVFASEAAGAFRDAQLDEVSAWCRRRVDEMNAWLAGDRDSGAELDAEDDALLLRAWQLRAGALPHVPGGPPLSYRHIAVDEVQDFSPLEVQVLMAQLDEKQSLTLAGDTQQHIGAVSGFHSWSELFARLGLESTAVETLQVSYRSSEEITRFALGLLGDLREDDTPVHTTRSGPPVELFQFTEHGAAIAALAEALAALASEEPLASVALLTPPGDLGDLYWKGLAQCEVPRLHRVQRQNFRFAPGIEITEVDQVKGLEFDYVILLDVNAEHYPDDARSRRLLHVGATRAVHQLWLMSVGETSRVVAGAIG
jgi:DNA helicase-2/ATP-dependent DNA helicase PcrA